MVDDCGQVEAINHFAPLRSQFSDLAAVLLQLGSHAALFHMP